MLAHLKTWGIFEKCPNMRGAIWKMPKYEKSFFPDGFPKCLYVSNCIHCLPAESLPVTSYSRPAAQIWSNPVLIFPLSAQQPSTVNEYHIVDEIAPYYWMTEFPSVKFPIISEYRE